MNGFTKYLLIILMLWAAIAGCRKNVTPEPPEPQAAADAGYVPSPAAITPSEPGGASEPEETPRPATAAPPEIFMEAERNFTAGNYRQAAQAFEKFLYMFPKAPERDRALFHLGFSLALSGGDKDLVQTEAALRRLIAEFPKSSYRRQAEWILDMKTQIDRLQSELKDRDQRIRQLGDELRKLKSIDLDRRPSRPE